MDYGLLAPAPLEHWITHKKKQLLPPSQISISFPPSLTGPVKLCLLKLTFFFINTLDILKDYETQKLDQNLW